ncbi:hypothetical protein [Kitasatospora sp. NPDC057500]|uniref:hypothetical protein n=1 Tax=Kitasatospora sp. NPDC057500 TaxID=3346151 RepID=UPI0036B45842
MAAAAAASISIVLAGTAAAPSASAASGGGCSEGSIRSCISYNGWLATVSADSWYYPTPPAGCTHQTMIINGNGNIVAEKYWDYCNSDRNPGVGYGTIGGDFYARTCFFLNNTVLACVDSPWQRV